MFKNLIAIIDDGVNSGFFESGRIKFDIEITEDLKIAERHNDDDDTVLSHGTNCAKIINREAPGSEFISIKILNEIAKGLSSQLVKALEWCIEKEIRLINLSLGTIDFRDYEPVKDVINKAYKKGIIIVAACNNRDIVTFPASLENVIGVKSDKSNHLKNDEYFYHENPVDGINIITSPYHTIVLNDISTQEQYLSNSSAAPKITALVYNILSENPAMSLSDVGKKLWEKSKNTSPQIKETYFNVTRRIDWAENCLLIAIGPGDIPMDKTKFPKIIKENVSLKVKTFSNSVLQSVLKKINETDDQIETIIVFSHHDLQLKKDDEKKLISCLLEYNKNFIYLNDKSKLKSAPDTKFTKKAWFPFNQQNFIDNQDKQVKGKNEVPIILINDCTCARHIEKISELVNCFKKDGYYAVALSEFSIGILFGFEYLFPYYYSGNDDLSRKLIKNLIAAFDPDLLFIIADGVTPSISYSKILKQDLEADFTLNLLPSEADTESRGSNSKIINLYTDGIFNIPERTRNTAFSVHNIKDIYKYIIKVFESDNKDDHILQEFDNLKGFHL